MTDSKTTLDAKTLAMYLGCEVEIPDSNGRKGTLSGVFYKVAINTWRASITHDEQVNHFKVEEIKPILRPLSSMTAEEKSEYNKRKQRKGYMAEIHADNTLWLLSRHFDLFMLIEKGEAIEDKP